MPSHVIGRRGSSHCDRGRRGSTNTGSVDLVGELADVAAGEDLWLHVDAA